MVCCFGEILLRFSPLLQGKFIEQASMPVYIGGAELNVATALANWNIPVNYITALPQNFLSGEIINALERKKINTKFIKYCGEKIGTYYLPQGADLKNNSVIYDRANSSFAAVKPGSFNWDEIFEDVTWFHFSAISPALNETAAAVCLEALQAASKRNITISTDLNYRPKLWQYGKQPIEIMPALIEYCHVVMGNIWSAKVLLGIALQQNFVSGCGNKNIYLQQATLTAKAIQQRFSRCHTVANTFRFDEGEGIEYFAALNNNEGQFSSSNYTAVTIADKAGSGDCFMAGLIYGLALQMPFQHIVEFASAAAFNKLQQKGDSTSSTVSEIQQIIHANG